MPKHLIIGCGTVDKHSFEYMKNRGSHEHLHPKTLYDTIDLNQETIPTFVQDINEMMQFTQKYKTVTLERFPAEYFKQNAIKNIDGMLEDHGLLIILPTGQRLQQFSNYMSWLNESGFKSAIISKSVNLIIASKEGQKELIETVSKGNLESPMFDLLTNKSKRETNKHDGFDYIDSSEFTTRIFSISKIVEKNLVEFQNVITNLKMMEENVLSFSSNRNILLNNTKNKSFHMEDTGSQKYQGCILL